MISTILFFGLMAFIYKNSPPESKRWVAFFAFMCALAKCGYEVSTFGMIMWAALAKVLKDLVDGAEWD